MATTIHRIPELLAQWQSATRPEDVFGVLGAPQAESLKRYYRQLIPLVHPDQHPHEPDATAAFQALQHWYQQAQDAVRLGRYGVAPLISIDAGAYRYTGFDAPLAGDICDVYAAQSGTQAVMLKIARSPTSRDLLDREAESLRLLAIRMKGERLRAHLPTLIDAVTIDDGSGTWRRCNVLRREHGTASLAAVLRRYPAGIAPTDAAWVFNRILAALAITHEQGLVHGAVLPVHVLIRPEDHNGILIDWCYSVERGEPLVAISRAHQPYYPPEVLAKQPATPATDLYMAAQCMIALLGGDVTSGALPAHVPAPIAAFLRGCRITTPSYRPTDAWALLEEFRQLLQRLYGPPTFRPFPDIDIID